MSTLRTLVIDTATAACSVALFASEQAGDVLLARAHETVGRGHAEHLLPMIATLPDGGRADRILVDVGPGSFTGIRVGVAAARGLALGWDASIAGYSSLAAIARGFVLDGHGLDPFAVVIEGGHGEVFMQGFAAHPGFHAQGEMASLRPDAALVRLGDRVAAGGGVRRLTGLTARQDGGADRLPDAAHVPLLPESYRRLPPRPLYGRAPDAKLPAPR